MKNFFEFLIFHDIPFDTFLITFLVVAVWLGIVLSYRRGIKRFLFILFKKTMYGICLRIFAFKRAFITYKKVVKINKN